ncbi:arabinose ABC transporter substrate-binding protein [Gemmobacter sp. 24YEA27]|uniref:arabinose ABC transporter substrate-binding protein n=1 Tax=Gemmobacter sp. 24YEA27 TaxID=3040672 RepID=UPI0024B35E44|nr:arabinose ABC transporter substrate-binding protein [Gemmobacter sp. 24YEA27]
MRFLNSIALAAGLGLSTIAGLATSVMADTVKIGFIVKQPEEPWFQDEWKFADQAGAEKGFEVVKIGATDGEQLMAAIDNLAAQGAQGFIVCTPDVNLGPAIVARAEAAGLKLMTVDDRLVDASGAEIDSVVHMGISARKIGETVGEALAAEIKARDWNPAEVGALKISYDQLPTAVDRTGGAVDALKAAGFPEANIYDAPQTRTDTEAALNAATVVLNQHPEVKHWIAFGLNDEAVLGAVRAAESVGIKSADIIGVGIGGAASAINEFEKPDATGFFGTVVISPKRHGYETALNMYEWVANGVEPEKLTLTAGALARRDDYKQVLVDLGVN